MNKINNDIINKFLLVGDKFMSETHLYQQKYENTLLVDHLLSTQKEFKILCKMVD